MPKKVPDSALIALKNEIMNEIREEVMNNIKTVQNGLKLEVKSLFSALEAQQQAINLMEKQFNMKIGGLYGNQVKKERQDRQKDDDILAEFETFEDFQAWLKVREQKLETNNSNLIEQTEPHPLTDQ